MFRWIIGSSLHFRFVVLGLAAAIVVFGAFQLQRMPVTVLPEFAPPIVEVQTEAIGLSAEEVESLVTLNLEELLSGVPWLESIRSESVTGLSSIVLTFERGTDIMAARQMIQERLTLAYTLPNVAQPPVILQPVSATNRFIMVGISSDRIEPTDLSLLARWTIKPKLLGVSGVANVAVWGQRLKELHVQVDPARLRDARLIQDDIITATGDALWVSPLTYLKGSMPGTGGWIDNHNQRIGVHHSMPIETPEDMSKIAVTPQHLLMTGKNLALGEVAEVTFSHAPLIGDAYVNGGHGLMLVIEKFPSANTIEVTRGVEAALAELKRGLPGVEINADVYRLASYIEDSIDNLTLAIIIGAGLVILVIGAFLFNWRTALISIISIPLSLFAAIIVLQLAGATINTMILAGLVLALGVVIDDAVVDVDRLMRRLRERAPGEGASIFRIIFETTLETRSVAVYAALVVIVAVIPIFFMGGLSGAFFGPLALAYLLAVVASMIVALTVTPALRLVLLGGTRGGGSHESLASRWLGSAYQALLRRIVSLRLPVLAGAAAVVAIGFGVWPLLGQSLLPSFKEGEILVSWNTAPGTSHAETYRITERVSEELKTLPGVRSVGAHIGRAITGDQIVGINASQIWVGLDEDADHEAVMAQVRETVAGYPGVESGVSTYLRDKIGEVLTGEAHPIVVRIFGHERDVLHAKAEEVRQSLGGIDGIVDVRTLGQLAEPQVVVKVDLDAAGRASVKPGDVRRSAATVFSGLTVGYLFDEQKINDVVVWSAPEVRHSLSDLEDLWVEKSNRHYVRLGDVAEVSVVPTPTVIRHESIAPYVDVVADVAGRDLGSVADEVDDRLEAIDFPLEYHPELLGEFAEREGAANSILGVSIAAVIGIFLLLQACLRSWRLAALAFLALPASVVGGVFISFASGGVISLGSIVGFLAVLGIAARNGIMLINHFQRLETAEGAPFGLELVLRGARERLSPILASSAAILAALLPIVALGQIPGLEIVHPTAIVIIGGLAASTLFTLFVIPPLYLLLGSGAADRADAEALEAHRG